MEVSGKGKLTIGVGRYNCDGTYSYYGANAAPAVDGFNKDQALATDRHADRRSTSSKEGRERSTIAFADNMNRKLTYTPFLDTASFAYDWELINQGFDITDDRHDRRPAATARASRTPSKLWETDKTTRSTRHSTRTTSRRSRRSAARRTRSSWRSARS